MSDLDLERLGEIPDPLFGGGPTGPAGPDPFLTRRASPTRYELRRRRRFALGAALSWSLAFLLLLGLRADLARLGPGYVAAWLALPFALAALALGAAVRASSTGLGVRVALAALIAVAAPTLLGALAVALPSETSSGVSLAKGIATCLGFTLTGAIPPFAFALAALRNSFAAGAGWRSGLVGAAAGLLAGGSMNLHCPLTNSLHLLAGHALPIALAVGFGALIGRRWLVA